MQMKCTIYARVTQRQKQRFYFTHTSPSISVHENNTVVSPHQHLLLIIPSAFQYIAYTMLSNQLSRDHRGQDV